MIRESHHGDVISEIRDKATDTNIAILPAPTLILPLSDPPLQYTWYPVTVAGGVQKIIKLLGPN